MVDIVDVVDHNIICVAVRFVWIAPFGYAVFELLACYCSYLFVVLVLCSDSIFEKWMRDVPDVVGSTDDDTVTVYRIST